MYETLHGKVVQLNTVNIHGLIFIDLTLEDEKGIQQRLRLQDTQIPAGLTADDQLTVELILGNVHTIERG